MAVRIFLFYYVVLGVAAAVLAGVVWLLWPGEGVSLAGALAIPSVALIVFAFSRLGVSSLGDDAAAHGYGSQRLSQQHRQGLRDAYHESGSGRRRRFAPGWAAIAALVTLWGVAALLFQVAGVA